MSSISRSRSSSISPEKLPTHAELFSAYHNQSKEKAVRIKQAFGYTNEDNPFGDTHLSKPFMWKKKLDKMQEKGEKLKISHPEMVQKQEDLIKEIEKVKQRRAEREIEKLKLDDQKNVISAEKEEEIYEQWVQKEENFHHEQAKIRPLKRIEQGRCKPVDHFVKLLSTYKEIKQFDYKLEDFMKKPYQSLKRLSSDDLKEFIIEANLLKEDEFEYQDFWKSLIRLAEEVKELKLRKTEIKQTLELKTRSALDQDYYKEIKGLLRGKNLDELDELECQIRKSLLERTFTMDIEYWETILKKIEFYRSNQTLWNYHSKYINKLDIENRLTSESKIKVYEENICIGQHSPYLLKTTKTLEKMAISQEENEDNIRIELNQIFENEMKKAVDLLKRQLKAGNKNPYGIVQGNVRAFQLNKLGEDDEMKYKIGLDKILDGENNNNNEENNDYVIAEQIMNYEKSKPLKPNEERFDDLVEIKKIYDWTEKYKPRKPQYFNRVRTGYEWNKYNQTHYDFENPPPKVIQGYRFNIFYPDLIDKSKTPEYTLEMAENAQFCIIKFKAGPPYEDIAFKIVNKEWDFADKKGFKSVFSRGILHLYFQFKKYRYRR